jgi:hypothetical protein
MPLWPDCAPSICCSSRQFFSPIALDAQMLKEIVDGRSEVDFCIVNNPFASLRRGISLPQSQLASLLSSGDPPPRWKWLSRPWS